MESNKSPEIPDRGETSDIPGLLSGTTRCPMVMSDSVCRRTVPDGALEPVQLERLAEVFVSST